MVSEMCSTIRSAQGRQVQPCVVILDGRTFKSCCESGPRWIRRLQVAQRLEGEHSGRYAGAPHCADGHTNHKGQERTQVDALRQRVQQAMDNAIKRAWENQS